MTVFAVATAEDGGADPDTDSSELSGHLGTALTNEVGSVGRCYRVTPASVAQSSFLDHGSVVDLLATGRVFYQRVTFEVVTYGTGGSRLSFDFNPTFSGNVPSSYLQLFQNHSNGERFRLVVRGSGSNFTTVPALNTVYSFEIAAWYEGGQAKGEVRMYDASDTLLETVTQATTVGDDGFNTVRYVTAYGSARGKGDTSCSYRVYLMWANDSQGSLNNSWPAGIEVDDGGGPLLPNAAGTYQDFSAVGPTHWEAVDEIPANDDTDYVSNSGAGAENETEQCAASTYNASTHEVVAVIFQAAGRIASGTTGNISLRVRDGGVDYDTDVTATLPSANYNGQIEKVIYEQRPGGGAWTQAAIDALEGGFSIDGADRVLRWTQGHFLVLTRPAAAPPSGIGQVIII